MSSARTTLDARHLQGDDRGAAVGAGHRHRAVERRQPPHHTPHAGARSPASAPPRPSSPTTTRSRPSLVVELDPGVLVAGVLGGVGEALGDREVDRRLDRRGRPARQVAGHLDGHRHVEGQRPDRAVEAAVGEHRRVDAADHRAQVGDGGAGRRAGLVDGPAGRLRVGVELRLGHAQAHRHRDQPGLGAVVQVALEPAQLGGGVVHGLGAAAGQRLDPLLERLGAAVGEEHPVDPRAHRHQRAACRTTRRRRVATASSSTTTSSEITQPSVDRPQRSRPGPARSSGRRPCARSRTSGPPCGQRPVRRRQLDARAPAPAMCRCRFATARISGTAATTSGDADPDDDEHARRRRRAPGRGAAAPARAPARRRTP